MKRFLFQFLSGLSLPQLVVSGLLLWMKLQFQFLSGLSLPQLSIYAGSEKFDMSFNS